MPCLKKLIYLYKIDTNVLLENTSLVKFIRKHIRDTDGFFSISSLVKISITSLISCLALKLYLNLLVYNRDVFGSSSKVFGYLRKSSVIFGNCSETFVWPSENSGSLVASSIACRYGISLLVFNFVSLVRCAHS